ncbi:unnamed protein product [Prorocentrum cordatum]|uniref:Uncharacterized protein n=1 Tax=Prorocentrum cordatum TaxID=2364126 RepID=A0ABN9W187_9DINO|nr:unnamed protein product [Polarella glacialis]
MKASATVALPKDAEELRTRLSLLGRAWTFVGFQQPNCTWLRGLSPQVFQDYLDHLLGPYVSKLYSRDAHGNQSAAPPWNLVLLCELEIWRKAMNLVIEGKALAQALKVTSSDPVTKERFFTAPLAMAATIRTNKRSYDTMAAPLGQARS